MTGPTIAEAINTILCDHHIVTFGECSKGRVEGGNAIKQRLIGAKNKQGEQVPALRFFSTCIHTIRTMPQLAHDKNNPELYDTKGEDHAADTVAYACMSRPWTPPKPHPAVTHDRYQHETNSSVWAV